MKVYGIGFKGDYALMTIRAKDASQARRIFNKQLQVQEIKTNDKAN